MNIEKCTKESFVVIGKEGSTLQGQGFIQKLWEEANENFEEIEKLALRNGEGKLIGLWGAMSDFSHSFKPWEDHFQNGLYLAGVECFKDAEPPKGWTKWIVPSYEYICVECLSLDVFPKVIKYMEENNIPLVGAVHDFSDPTTKKEYMYFPIKRI